MRVVIVGTGTSVGKTHLTVALLTALAESHVAACGLKPIESGVPAGQVGADAMALSAAGSFHVKHPQPYALPDPVSPHLAARRAGIAIDLALVLHWVDEHNPEWLLVETAGAVLSPLGPRLTNLELGWALLPDVWVLVAVDRLGVLHDVTACMRVLAASGIRPAAVILQAPEVPDESTGTNVAELLSLGIAQQVFRMPRGEPQSEACRTASAVILRSLL